MRNEARKCAQLCRHCRVLEFDDATLQEEGAVSRTEDGQEYLSFPGKTRSLYLEFQREDTFPDLPGLAESASQGCGFCQLLRSRIRKELAADDEALSDAEEDRSFTERVTFDRMRLDWIDSPNLALMAPRRLKLVFLTVMMTQIDRGGYQPRIVFQLSASPGPCATWLGIPLMPVFDDMLSSENVQVLRSWIHDCANDCHPQAADHPLPTRLIDVGKDEDTAHLHLVETAGCHNLSSGANDADRRYAALSYCWGSKPALTTERSTLATHMESISLDSLPQTCRDAVIMTRRLGLRYLWIDALCIIQDDTGDWEMESARMADAYRNAYVTLVDLKGSSCHDGFLQPRTQNQIKVRFRSSVRPEIGGEYWLRQLPLSASDRESNFVPFKYLDFEDRVNSRWNTRGWTYQEDLLSTRRLLFGRHMVHFQCGKKIRSEDGDIQLPTMDDWCHHLNTKAVSEDLYDLCWNRMMPLITQRDFSFQKDKLPAISAMAELFQRRTGDRYLAGIWRGDLARGLLWYIKERRTPTHFSSYLEEQNEEYVAPSWSWPSVTGEINWLHSWEDPWISFRLVCEILEAETVIDGLNVFGRVNSGHLLLRGCACPLSEDAEVCSVEHDSMSLYGDPNSDYDDVFLGTEPLSHQILLSGQYIAHCEFDFDVPHNERGPSNESIPERWLSKVLVFFVAENVKVHLEWLDSQSIDEEVVHKNYGLLLYPTAKDDAWRRVGVFKSIPYEGGGRAFFDTCNERTIRIV